MRTAMTYLKIVNSICYQILRNFLTLGKIMSYWHKEKLETNPSLYKKFIFHGAGMFRESNIIQ